ncbi:unnamed protein product [Lactuca virosa]|uniref:MOM1 alpha-helical domain-containing protein n=1 Tax=Lactuca virosa TaxID=75947 RepID=A0AAU9N3H6_9ASTR|nr:unnamed protein product [Lactuca virosa]
MDAPVPEVRTEGEPDVVEELGQNVDQIIVKVDELLHPTVHELCKILKFPEDVKNKVDGFLDFVLKNYNVSREDTSTLQAFMISLCWIGASLAKHKIDRRESFDLAKKQLNFYCKEKQVNFVHLKLEEAKEDFLKQTETEENIEVKIIRQRICEKNKEHERDKDVHLKELKSTLLAADVTAKPETSVSVGNLGDKMPETPLELDGGIYKFLTLFQGFCILLTRLDCLPIVAIYFSRGMVGVAEMKVVIERTGGLAVLAESFGHSVFKDSIRRVFDKGEESLERSSCCKHSETGEYHSLEVVWTR